MRRIVVLNAKGGCGKTTLATGLAAYYARQGHEVALMDYDSQSSSLGWLARRPPQAPQIHGIAAYQRPGAMVTRSWQLRMPPTVERIIVDTPAGMDRQQIQDLVLNSDALLLPILPSPIDIHAASRFIGDLLLLGKIRQYRRRLGVVANRAHEETAAYRSLERFLATLDIPFVTTLRDNEAYLAATEQGLGISELSDGFAEHDRRQWQRLADWLEREERRVGQMT